LNYTEEWRDQALRNSDNLPTNGKVPIPATSDKTGGNYNLNENEMKSKSFYRGVSRKKLSNTEPQNLDFIQGIFSEIFPAICWMRML